MIFYLDVNTTAQEWEQFTPLDGREYTLRFRWNARAQGWYLDVGDQDNSPIVSGVRLVLGLRLGRQVVGDSRMWPGTLACVSTTSDQSDPGLTELGQRVLVVYDDLQPIVG